MLNESKQILTILSNATQEQRNQIFREVFAKIIRAKTRQARRLGLPPEAAPPAEMPPRMPPGMLPGMPPAAMPPGMIPGILPRMI